MRYVHTMVRVSDLEESLDFWCNKVGLVEIRRKEVPEGKFTLVFLAAPKDKESAEATTAPELELTYNWDSDEVYETGRSWGHLAYKVDDIHAFCQKLMDAGVTINRPPRDGRMAFFKSPDNISVELIQDGPALDPTEPWVSMENTGDW
ncbi:VOC family protein [Maritimibacter sp. UBA3975]|uniref:VOC family protein n=1 Tax=Maritimibacter sp. UBA3975 TaxID=1946833 RepID=UPI000C095420|nr:VOC family protein [Maritimibacter sp. UBA3975]MAM63704.1 lactoylglutathione lyase [Maritimibacter sp.]|tara:strand:- start:15827 stop:16270 length:444 start_codon:yes stop_codon:yes gene_type:complete